MRTRYTRTTTLCPTQSKAVSAELPPRLSPHILRRMCTLAIYFQVSDDFPVVVAANRDEFYERPATAPAQLSNDPWVVAGQDLVAGGTWLGVNAHNLVAALVNRRTSTTPDPTRRSRGQLCVDILRHGSVSAARRRVESDPGTLYNPFNLLITSPQGACVVGNVSGTMTSTVLTPGLHLLTNLDLNDFECPRIAKSYGLFDAARRHLRLDAINDLLPALRSILSDHSTPLDPRNDGPPNNLCVHTERFGTRSSSILLYVAAERRFRFWHANSAPCQTTYAEVPLPKPLEPIGQA
jgi:uncharacterized protein with NRDE domain